MSRRTRGSALSVRGRSVRVKEGGKEERCPLDGAWLPPSLEKTIMGTIGGIGLKARQKTHGKNMASA